MGWSTPEIWVEINEFGYWMPVFRVDRLYSCSRWRSFLLGGKKYGRTESWTTEQNSKGVPEDVSKLVSKRVDNQKWVDASYYDFEELKQIDLDKEMLLPENPENVSDFEYCLDLSIKLKDEEIKELDGNPKLPDFKISTIQEAVKNEEIEITFAKIRIKDLGTQIATLNYIEDLDNDEAEELDYEEVQGKLKVERKTRRSFARDFEAFLSLLDFIKNQKDLKNEQVRIVMWLGRQLDD